jgi:hypothetical protein
MAPCTPHLVALARRLRDGADSIEPFGLRAWRVHWIAEAMIARCRLAIVARLGHRLKVAPGIHQSLITTVWCAMINHSSSVSTAALTQRMLHQIRRA